MRDVIYLSHRSGANHAFQGARLKKLRKEILAGRGGPEVTTLVMNGYEGYLAEDGTTKDFESLNADFAAGM